jgi:TolA-binding protein
VAGHDHRAVKGQRSRARELVDALKLALVPLGVAVTLGLLLLPRRTWPDSVPLPLADPAGLARAAAVDHELAEHARREPLSQQVRALGSALRDYHTMETLPPALRDTARATTDVERALKDALPAGDEPLLRLRAVQLEGFLEELRRFETTGEQSAELKALGGDFVGAMRIEGWSDDRTIAPGEAARRAMFKQMWTSLLGLDGRPGFAVPLDEQRALYAFYLAHPHVAPSARDTLAAARRGANSEQACRSVAEAEQVALEAWRLERIRRLARIDPAYPAGYATGVALLRHGDSAAAAEALRAWLAEHPDGPYTLRAQDFLRSAAAHIGE